VKITIAPGVVLIGVLSWAQEDTAVALAARGKEAMASGRFAEAARIYAVLVKRIPSNAGLHLNLGMARYMAGDVRGAVPELETALRLEPGLGPAQLFLGAAYLASGAPAKAVKLLAELVGREPANAKARQMLGDALFALGRVDESLSHFGKLAELEPENPRAWYGLGKSYEVLSREAYHQLEKLAPESAYWLALTGGRREAQRQFRSAFFFYREALRMDPSLRGLHGALARIYRETGHPDWANIEEQRERALGSPACATVPLECEFAAGRFHAVLEATRTAHSPASLYWRVRAANELALAAFRKLAALPESRELHEFLAEAHRNRGNHMEAANEWRQALRFAPGDRYLQKELAMSLHLSRDYSGASEAVEKLLREDPDSAELNYLLGDALLNLQQAARAIPYLEKAAAADPSLLPARASLGRAYLQSGLAARAVPHLRAALPLDEDGSLHFQLARAYQNAGQPELARRTLAKYREIQSARSEDQRRLEEQVQIEPP
jgi:tetratricopeptide (TPR) repeat protein